MLKQKKWIVRDPHFYWKLTNMTLALAVLVLAGLILVGGKEGWLVTAAFLLGAVMSASEGIMQLAKGRRVLGYGCSVIAGLMVVGMIIHVIIRVW